MERRSANLSGSDADLSASLSDPPCLLSQSSMRDQRETRPSTTKPYIGYPVFRQNGRLHGQKYRANSITGMLLAVNGASEHLLAQERTKLLNGLIITF